MNDGSSVKSDRGAGFATILKGGNDMRNARCMNRRLQALLSLILLAAIVYFTAAGVAWSQTLPGASRFSLVLNNTAVFDKETGLLWEQSPDARRRDWRAAQHFCNTKTVGGEKGWRMPTARELSSLVDPTQFSPALPSGHPFNNVRSSYWSASTDANETPIAWDLSFNSGGASFDKAKALPVWCVRGGQSAAHQ